MELIRTIWMFFQDQILGMKWLNALIGKGLSAMGLDLDSIRECKIKCVSLEIQQI